MSDNADQQVNRVWITLHLSTTTLKSPKASIFKATLYFSPSSLKTFGYTRDLQLSGGQNLNEPLSIFPQRYGPFEIWQLHRTRWSTHGGESIGGWARQRGHCVDSNQTLTLSLFFLFIQLLSNCRKGSNEMWWIMGRESAQHRIAKLFAPFWLDQWRWIRVQIMNKERCSAPPCVRTFVFGLLLSTRCVQCLHYVPLLLTVGCLQVLLAWEVSILSVFSRACKSSNNSRAQAEFAAEFNWLRLMK